MDLTLDVHRNISSAVHADPQSGATIDIALDFHGCSLIFFRNFYDLTSSCVKAPGSAVQTECEAATALDVALDFHGLFLLNRRR